MNFRFYFPVSVLNYKRAGISGTLWKGIPVSPEQKMEIERKWMVKGWPSPELPLLFEQEMRQGYISLAPTVRIREEAMVGGGTEYVLCIKSPWFRARQAIEFNLEKDIFALLVDLLGLPLIRKAGLT